MAEGPTGGHSRDAVLAAVRPSHNVTLEVPKALEAIMPVHFTCGSTEQKMANVNADWFKKPVVDVSQITGISG